MISVVIPVFQAERFVEKAVLSACDQVEVSEVIIVEDCSPDSSLLICERLAHNYPSKGNIYRHPDNKNHGAGASRNLGIKKAKGAFISFLDADDYFLPNRFKNDVRILQHNEYIDGVYNALGVEVYDATEQGRINTNLTTVKYPIPPDKLFEEMAPMGRGGYFHGDTLTVRSEIFDSVGYFDQSLELSQDTQMWFKMAAKATLVAGIIDRPVAMRGVHTGNRIKDKAKFDYYRPLLFRSLFDWANKNDIPVVKKKMLWDMLYKYDKRFIINKNLNLLKTKITLLSSLVRYGFVNPYLLSHKNYLLSYLRLLTY